MKKFGVGVLVFLLLFSLGAIASISVDWFTYGTIYMNDGTTPLPVGSIAQLIWTSDSTISAAATNGANVLVPTGGEILLSQIALTDEGAIYEGAATYNEEDYWIGDTNYFANGYVYTRVFAYLASSGVPTNDTWYGEGPVTTDGPISSQHASSPPAPTPTDITGANSFTLNQQVVIPEPTTMAIMGIGLLTLASRRFRRK